MAAGTTSDAQRAFDAIARHLSAKRLELRVAIEYGRGVEGWLQHETLVALDNAYYGDLGGRLQSYWREGMRHKDSPTFDPSSRRRPFDLEFDQPHMAASIKLYLPWKSRSEAIKEVRADLIELRDHPHHGFFIAGRLDFADEPTSDRRRSRGPKGGDWLVEVVREAQTDMRLRPLARQAEGSNPDYLYIELPPLLWPEEPERYRVPFLALGGWSVWHSTTG